MFIGSLRGGFGRSWHACPFNTRISYSKDTRCVRGRHVERRVSGYGHKLLKGHAPDRRAPPLTAQGRARRELGPWRERRGHSWGCCMNRGTGGTPGNFRDGLHPSVASMRRAGASLQYAAAATRAFMQQPLTCHTIPETTVERWERAIDFALQLSDDGPVEVRRASDPVHEVGGRRSVE